MPSNEMQIVNNHSNQDRRHKAALEMTRQEEVSGLLRQSLAFMTIVTIRPFRPSAL